MQHALSAVIGVSSSLIASLVWLVSLRQVKPKIIISPVIARETLDDGLVQYTIKIINRSRRAAVSVHVELVIAEAERTRGGPVMTRTYLNLSEPDPLVIRSRRRKVDPNSWYPSAYRVRTTDNLQSLANSENKYVRVRIHANHEISGAGKVFERYYYHPESEIVPGRFSRGNTFEVVST